MLNYRLHFIRHARTEANEKGLFVGITDTPLSENGRAEIAALAEKYTYPYCDVIFSSPLSRCRETAGIVYPEREITLIDELSEFNFGDFENMSYEELKDNEHFIRWNTDTSVALPGGESTLIFGERIKKGLEKAFKLMMQEQVSDAAVFTHGGVIMSLLAAYGYPRAQYTNWLVDNGLGFTIIITPQMWMRDEAFEIFERLPRGVDWVSGNEVLSEYYGGNDSDD